jgi:PD-(D/E)XK endonuclease
MQGIGGANPSPTTSSYSFMLTSEQKGELAQLKVQLRAVEKGCVVSRPTVQCRYDMIIDDGKRLLRAQVKYGDRSTQRSQGAVRVDLRKRHKSFYDDREIDVLFVYLPKIDRVLAFMAENFSGCKELCVRFTHPNNNQRKKIRLADDFVW